jgi:hypothetical protein
MNIVDKVQSALGRDSNNQPKNSAALAAAERLADMYADIKPIPFIVPIERFSGLPFESRLSKNAC